MGCINKLSKIKSVFIVPIDKNMDKIKIDFFIKPQKGQEHRSATFTIVDFNRIKYMLNIIKRIELYHISNIILDQKSYNHMTIVKNSL